MNQAQGEGGKEQKEKKKSYSNSNATSNTISGDSMARERQVGPCQTERLISSALAGMHRSIEGPTTKPAPETCICILH